MEEHYDALTKALRAECEKYKLPDNIGSISRRKIMRKRRSQVSKCGNESSQPTILVEEMPKLQIPKTASLPPVMKSHSTISEKLSWSILATLIVLLVLNAILYYKLWSLEDTDYVKNSLPSLKLYLNR